MFGRPPGQRVPPPPTRYGSAPGQAKFKGGAARPVPPPATLFGPSAPANSAPSRVGAIQPKVVPPAFFAARRHEVAQAATPSNALEAKGPMGGAPPGAGPPPIGTPAPTSGASSSSTAFLGDLSLVPKADTGSWNTDHPELKFAHHKFPKGVLAWLFEHMSEPKRVKLRTELFLRKTAQAMSLTRLRSNLIAASAADCKTRVASEARLDDPNNNRKASLPGEEFLDLVHMKGGGLSPRSRIYSELAQNVVKAVYDRYRDSKVAADFLIDDADADRVIGALVEAEAAHYAIEGNPKLPSRSDGDAFAWSSDGGFRKVPVCALVLGSALLHSRLDGYRKAKAAEVEARLAFVRSRQQIILKLLGWLRVESKTVAESDRKSDFTKANVLYICGRRRGQKTGRHHNGWTALLKRYTEPNGGQTDETMPDWFPLIFEG